VRRHSGPTHNGYHHRERCHPSLRRDARCALRPDGPDLSLIGRPVTPLRDAGSALAELIWPTRCAGCGVSGTVLCESCTTDVQLIDPTHACPVCGAASGRMACTECPSRTVELPTYNISAALY